MQRVRGTVILLGCTAAVLAGCGTRVLLGGLAASDAGASPSSADSSSSGSSGGPGGGDAIDAGTAAAMDDAASLNGADGATSAADGGAATTGGGGGGTAAGSAVQCNLLTTTLCTAGAQCVPGTNVGNCESQLNLEFGCGWATGGDFTSCLQGGQAVTCDNLYPDGGLTLPLACRPPITATPLGDAQTKCYALVDALCAQSIQCLGMAATSDLVQNCEDDVTTDLQDGLPCLLAATVGAGYAQCIAAIPSLSCEDAGAAGDAGGSGISITTIPACANALTFSP